MRNTSIRRQAALLGVKFNFSAASLVALTFMLGGCASDGLPSGSSASIAHTASFAHNNAGGSVVGASAQSAGHIVSGQTLAQCFKSTPKPSVMSFALRGQTGTSSTAIDTAIDYGPDRLTRYARAQLSTARKTGQTTTALNAQAKQHDLACLAANTQGGQHHRSLHQTLNRIYAEANYYLSLRQKDDIPEQIARGFQAETLVMGTSLVSTNAQQ